MGCDGGEGSSRHHLHHQLNPICAILHAVTNNTLLIGIRDLSDKIDKGIAATDTKVGLLADDVALKIDSLTVDLKVETVRN